MKNNQQGWVVPIIIGIVLVFVLLMVLGAVSSKKPAAESKSPPAVSQPAPQLEPQQSLAKLTQDAMLKSFGYNSLQEMQQAQWPADSNLGYITGFEDVSDGTVRMNIQKDVTKDEAKETGITVMGAVGGYLPELKYIVARGTDGRDVNISRNDVPALR